MYAAAVGAYFKGGQLAPIDLIVEERFHRAAPGGTGGTKAAGNYTPVRARVLSQQARSAASLVIFVVISMESLTAAPWQPQWEQCIPAHKAIAGPLLLRAKPGTLAMAPWQMGSKRGLGCQVAIRYNFHPDR